MSDKSTSSIVFTGDIGFDRFMYGQWNDPELIDSRILEFLHSADHVCANVEGPIYGVEANTTTTGAQQLLHSIDPAAVKVLDNMGADIWNLCNNHIMDEKQEGLKSTLDIANRNGIKTLGVGMNLDEARKPVILNEAGGIGMIGVGYQRACRKATEDMGGCYSWSELELIEESIKAIKNEYKCRWCVVVAHAGEEFTSLPSPYTRERFLKYLEMGADAVICHHPHVPMNYELVDCGSGVTKPIFYSLGNFIFDTPYQRTQFNTEVGIIVKLRFTTDELTFESMGVHIDRDKEHVIAGDLPAIYQHVSETEYNKLLPLSVKAFISATKRQFRYLKPEQFNENTTEEQWMEHFYEPLRTGRVPGETLDMQILVPIAKEAEKGAWKESTMDDIKEYILRQI